jgi:hypothetical protein
MIWLRVFAAPAIRKANTSSVDCTQMATDEALSIAICYGINSADCAASAVGNNGIAKLEKY